MYRFKLTTMHPNCCRKVVSFSKTYSDFKTLMNELANLLVNSISEWEVEWSLIETDTEEEWISEVFNRESPYKKWEKED